MLIRRADVDENVDAPGVVRQWCGVGRREGCTTVYFDGDFDGIEGRMNRIRVLYSGGDEAIHVCCDCNRMGLYEV